MLSIRSQSTQPLPSHDVRRDGLFWAVIAALFVASVWGTVRMCRSMSGNDMVMPGGWTMSMAWMRMPGQTWPDALLSFLSMWTVMMAAMMLPCLAPMLRRYRHLTCGRALDVRTVLAGAGYFATWVLFGVLAYAVGIPIAYAQMRYDALSTPAPLIAAVVVLIAGVAQFTGGKARLLDHCRSCIRPSTTFGAFRHGFRLGVECGKCCAGYMLILLVTNVMSLPIMAALTVAVTAERLLPHPALVARLTGAAAIVDGLVILAHAI